jgi:hypothetical protein
MPEDKKKAARKSAKAKRGGARRIKAANVAGKMAQKSAARGVKRKAAGNARGARKAEIRSMTRSTTSSNLKSTGSKQLASGKKTTRSKDQVVTPKSAHNEQKKKYGKSYGGMSKSWRGDLPKRGKRKGSV